MTTENVIAILDNLDIAVFRIEKELNMPSGTLAKAKKGDRNLPDKWDKVLCEYFLSNSNKPADFDVKKYLDEMDLKNKVGSAFISIPVTEYEQMLLDIQNCKSKENLQPAIKEEVIASNAINEHLEDKNDAKNNNARTKKSTKKKEASRTITFSHYHMFFIV